MHRLLSAFLSEFRWYRKWHGGHWERWIVDIPGCGEVWHEVDLCSYLTNQRPTPVCRGTPVCEDWGFQRILYKCESCGEAHVVTFYADLDGYITECPNTKELILMDKLPGR